MSVSSFAINYACVIVHKVTIFAEIDQVHFWFAGQGGIVLRTNPWLVLRLTWKTSLFNMQDFSVPVLLLTLQNLPLYKSHWRQWSFATCICLIRFPVLKAILEDVFNCILSGAEWMMGKVEQKIVLDCLSVVLKPVASGLQWLYIRRILQESSCFICILYLSLTVPVPFIGTANYT